MATKLQIHTPYVLQALPRPLDGPDGSGRYLAGDVFGQKQDDKRRKRTELAVAIDGVAVYLYDVRTPNTLAFWLFMLIHSRSSHPKLSHRTWFHLSPFSPARRIPFVGGRHRPRPPHGIPMFRF